MDELQENKLIMNIAFFGLISAAMLLIVFVQNSFLAEKIDLMATEMDSVQSDLNSLKADHQILALMIIQDVNEGRNNSSALASFINQKCG